MNQDNGWKEFDLDAYMDKWDETTEIMPLPVHVEPPEKCPKCKCENCVMMMHDEDGLVRHWCRKCGWQRFV